MVHPFFPYYSPEVREIVPWDAGIKAILDSARPATLSASMIVVLPG
jgi:hypothetical protein